MRTNAFQNSILTDLFKNRDGLLEFTLYNRYKRPLKELIMCIDELLAQNLIIEIDEKILLTQKGIDFITSQRALPPRPRQRPTDEIITDFYRPRLGINEFYVPKIHAETRKMGVDNEEE